VEVTVGVQQPDKVDAAVVKASLPHGEVTVTVVKGGLDVPENLQRRGRHCIGRRCGPARSAAG